MTRPDLLRRQSAGPHQRHPAVRSLLRRPAVAVTLLAAALTAVSGARPVRSLLEGAIGRHRREPPARADWRPVFVDDTVSVAIEAAALASGLPGGSNAGHAVWTRWRYQQPHEISPGREYLESRELLHLDCERGRYALEVAVLRDPSGRELTRLERPQPAWEIPPAGSVAAAVLRVTCALRTAEPLRSGAAA